MGFHSPSKRRGLGGKDPAPTSTSTSHLRPKPGGGGGPREGLRRGGGQESCCGSPGNQNRAPPREERLQEGGARCSEETERRTPERRCRATGDPSWYHTQGPRRGRKGPVSEKKAELTPRSSSERKSGPSSRPSCGVAGPGAPGEKMELGRHKGRH